MKTITWKDISIKGRPTPKRYQNAQSLAYKARGTKSEHDCVVLTFPLLVRKNESGYEDITTEDILFHEKMSPSLENLLEKTKNDKKLYVELTHYGVMNPYDHYTFVIELEGTNYELVNFDSENYP